MGAMSHVNTELESAKAIGAGSGVLTIVKGDNERKALASKIAKAVLTFQNQLLDRDANTGSLCQARFVCLASLQALSFKVSFVLVTACRGASGCSVILSGRKP